MSARWSLKCIPRRRDFAIRITPSGADMGRCTTGMRAAEIFGLNWSDAIVLRGALAVRAKLKGGKMRYGPMLPEVADEWRRFPAVIGEDRIFPPKSGATSGRQRVEGSFEDLLERAAIRDFRFHDLRHTFASWFMMNGGDLYELAKILGHSNIKMTERYAKLGRQHIARTGSSAGNLEINGNETCRTSERRLRMFGYCSVD
jgi:integrase